MALKTLFRRLVLLETLLSLAVLTLFHPSPYDDVAGELVPFAGFWTVSHAVRFVLFALMGRAAWTLVEGLGGVAATGISTGIMTKDAAGAPAGERAGLFAAVETLFLLALVAAGISLRWAEAPLPPLLLLLLLPAFFMTFDHAFPFGSLTFASFFLVALRLERAWRRRLSLRAGVGRYGARLT